MTRILFLALGVALIVWGIMDVTRAGQQGPGDWTWLLYVLAGAVLLVLCVPDGGKGEE